MQMPLAASLPRFAIQISRRAGKNRRPGKRASALLATLCFAGVLSLSVSGYLAVCYRSLVVSNRELISSHCMELAEMGMDELLWAKNNSFDSSWVITFGVATKTVSDPEFPSSPPYPDPSSVPFRYDNGAKGVVMLKYVIATNQASAVGVVTLADGTVVRRALSAVVRPAQLFTNAIGATGGLKFTIGGTVNSYSATDPLNFGTYTFGPTAVISGATVDLANAAIYGFAATQGTTLQSLTNAIVSGSLSGTDIDASRVSSRGSQPLFPTVTPSGVTDRYDPVTHYSQLTNSDTINAPGNYHYDSILLDGSQVLTIDAPVVLKVTNYVYIGLGSQIHVTTNGSLQLQIDSTNYDSSDVRVANAALLPQGLYLVGGGIVNDSQRPANVTVQIGSAIATDSAAHSYSFLDTSVPFFGSIYLPNDTIDIVNNDFTLYGALVGRNINFTGTAPAIHFDPTLHDNGVSGVNLPFALFQLRELTPAEIATL